MNASISTEQQTREKDATANELKSQIEAVANQKYLAHRTQHSKRVDRLFAGLYVIQWAVAILMAFFFTPKTWEGYSSYTHIHMYMAVLGGGLATLFPLYFIWKRSGEVITRHIVVSSAMVYTTIFTHLAGGVDEAHFHFFVMMAFIGLYFDWKVIVTATVVIAVDHVFRTIFFPLSIFGVIESPWFQLIRHCLWALFESGILIYAAIFTTKDWRTMAWNSAQNEVLDQKNRESIQKELELKETSMKEREAFNEKKRQDQQALEDNVSYILSNMEKFKNGDLTINLNQEAKGVMGKLFVGFNRAVFNIKEMFLKVNQATATTIDGITQIQSATEQIALGMKQQSQQTQEVAIAVEKMTQNIVANTNSALQAASEASKNGTTAQEGGQIVNQTVDKIRQIASVVDQSAQTVERLGQSSTEIGEIVAVIEEIADQTNLLALNAAIEAARAGEQGRGFAVVADEVRKLAERTTTATKQIADMVKSIQSETTKTVVAIKKGQEEVVEGLTLADRASEALTELVSHSGSVAAMVNEIATAWEKQSTDSEKISQNVDAISTVSTDSASKIVEIAHSANHLSESALDLQALVVQFKMGTAQYSASLARSHEGQSAIPPQ